MSFFLRSGEEGQGLAEYAFILVVVTIVVLTALILLSPLLARLLGGLG